LPRSQKLVVASRRSLDPAFHREWAGTEFDMLAIGVTASGIDRHIDTVFSSVQLGNGLFHLSREGNRLLYSSGPVETMVSTIDVDSAEASTPLITRAWSSTTFVRGRMAPSGDKVLLARDAPSRGRNVSQFSLVSRNGGEELQLQGTVLSLLGFEWSRDGERIMYLHRTEENEIRLMERGITGQVTREISRLERAPAQFQPMPRGAIATIPEDRRSISVIRERGEQSAIRHVPDWMSGIGSISPSPDGKSIAVEGMNRSFDSVVVATVDVESGRFVRLGSFPGSDPQKIVWLDDGRILFALREKQGAFALYAIARGRPARRLGILPYTQPDYSVSRDGKHATAFGYSDKKDVYMIRNLVSNLRR
jgi:dipeptidyl aminopeptidase/acylaminoacyl peptidase